jgi:hypothetical protein
MRRAREKPVTDQRILENGDFMGQVLENQKENTHLYFFRGTQKRNAMFGRKEM